ncbi:MAG: hypothetical protein AABX00_00885 [Nanoarchaeota archaeon]
MVTQEALDGPNREVYGTIKSSIDRLAAEAEIVSKASPNQAQKLMKYHALEEIFYEEGQVSETDGQSPIRRSAQNSKSFSISIDYSVEDIKGRIRADTAEYVKTAISFLNSRTGIAHYLSDFHKKRRRGPDPRPRKRR